MTKEQWTEMTEFMKEEPSVVTDYLETMYDEIPDEDIRGLYEAVLDKRAESDEREELFEELLSELYELTEERPKEFYQKMRKAKGILLAEK